MFVLLFSLSIFSALGAVIIDGLGVYNSTSEQYIERIFRDKVNDELYNTALMYYYSKETPELRDSNLCIVILDENKTPVYGNKNSSKTTIYSSQLDLIVTYYKNGDFNTDYISGKNYSFSLGTDDGPIEISEKDGKKEMKLPAGWIII